MQDGLKRKTGKKKKKKEEEKERRRERGRERKKEVDNSDLRGKQEVLQPPNLCV